MKSFNGICDTKLVWERWPLTNILTNTECGRETGDYKATMIRTLYLQNYKNFILKYTTKLITF